jgi:hypothetical protein
MNQVASVLDGNTLKILHALPRERIRIRNPNDTQKNGATSSIVIMGTRTF